MEQMAEDGVTVVRDLVGKMGKPNRRGDAFVDSETVFAVALANGEDQKSTQKLIEKLVQESRWEPFNDGWWVLGYLEFNYTDEEWKTYVAGRSRGGLHSTRPPVQHQSKQEPNFSNDSSSTSCGTDAATLVEPPSSSFTEDDSYESSSEALRRSRSACSILARREYESQVAAGSIIKNPDSWMSAVRTARKRTHADRIQLADIDFPNMTAEELADWLEPPARAAQEVRAPGVGRTIESCEKCVNGFLEHDDGSVTPCSHLRVVSA